jgi:CRP/FNR family cyclic AMP-dependent transcriptional regulator
MISTELLRKYPFFAMFDAEQLKKIAMITEQEEFTKGSTLFYEGQTAKLFFLLMEGSVDLYFQLGEPVKEISVGEVNPGEPFGISAFVEPHILTSTGRTANGCVVLKMQAIDLNKLCEDDISLAYLFMKEVAKAAMVRLNSTRVQLAAAWA